MEIIIGIILIFMIIIVRNYFKKYYEKRKILYKNTWNEIIQNNEYPELNNIFKDFFLIDCINPIKFVSNYKTLTDIFISSMNNNEENYFRHCSLI